LKITPLPLVIGDIETREQLALKKNKECIEMVNKYLDALHELINFTPADQSAPLVAEFKRCVDWLIIKRERI